MGAGNVKAAYAIWAVLPDHAFRVLVYMALIAKDGDEPPKYWAGQESLSIALGRELPDAPQLSESERRARDATLRAISRAKQVLLDCRAITLSRAASPGRTAEYALNLRLEDLMNVGRPASYERRTPGVGDVGRLMAERRTPGGGTQDAQRPTEEEHEHKDLLKDHSASVAPEVEGGIPERLLLARKKELPPPQDAAPWMRRTSTGRTCGYCGGARFTADGFCVDPSCVNCEETA